MPRPLYIFFEWEIWISFVLGLWAFFSAWVFKGPGSFRAIGKSKTLWMAITPLGFVPFAGIIPALAYLILVRSIMPERTPREDTERINLGRSSTSSSNTAPQTGSPRSHSGSSSGYSYPPPPVKARCHNPMCSGGMVTCTLCQGSGRGTDSSGRVGPHQACGGTGKIRCSMGPH